MSFFCSFFSSSVRNLSLRTRRPVFSWYSRGAIQSNSILKLTVTEELPPTNMCIPLSQKWYTHICGRELLSENRQFQDGIGLFCTARVPREDRPARSRRQDPHRGVQEGAEEAQLCKMEEEEPARVSSAALPTLERCMCVQKAGKGDGARAVAAAKTRGLSRSGLS